MSTRVTYYSDPGRQRIWGRVLAMAGAILAAAGLPACGQVSLWAYWPAGAAGLHTHPFVFHGLAWLLLPAVGLWTIKAAPSALRPAVLPASHQPSHRSPWPFVGMAAGILAVALAAVCLAADLGAALSGVPALPLGNPAACTRLPLAGMTALQAIALFCLGAASMLLSRPSPGLVCLAHRLALVPAALGAAGLVEWAFGIMPTRSWPPATPFPPAIAAGLCVMACAALLTRMEQGWFRRLADRPAARAALGRLLPWCALPVMAGLVTAAALHQAILRPEEAIALLALLSAAVFAWRSWQSAMAAGREEAAQVRNAERFRRFVDNAPSKLLMTDASGRCTGANGTMQRFSGVPEARLLGEGWATALYPEEAVLAPAAWRQSVHDGQVWQAEYRMRRHDGAYVWHLIRGMPMRNASGQISEWLIACIDIQPLMDVRESLSRSNAELGAVIAARTAELAQLQKIDALGQLTAGVAHDFNNLLQPILGSLEMLQRRLPPGDEPNQRMVETGLQSTARAATLVQRLLAFARRQDLQPRSIDVGSLLIDLDELIRRTLGNGGELAVDIEPGLPAARVDPNQLELAILNLAINARDAMTGGGLLTISVMGRRIPELRAAGTFGPPLKPGHYLCISVSDTGVGMDEATLARAVEPFFSTKGVGRGTGLGLSMAHGLAAQSGGALRLTSAPGQGTTAEIWLPSSGEAPVPHRYVPTVVPAPAKPATILLVDDEELVRGGTSDLLVDIGYVVIEAGSGAEAKRYLRDPGLTLDIMVTDYLMPGINGADLAAEAERLRPAMPVLLVTGYSAMPDGPASRLPRLAKPFRQADMAIEVARLLGRPGPATPWTPAGRTAPAAMSRP